MKKLFSFILAAVFCTAALVSCNVLYPQDTVHTDPIAENTDGGSDTNESGTITDTINTTQTDEPYTDTVTDGSSIEASPNVATYGGGTAVLNGTSISFDGSGAVVNGNVMTISSSGTYAVSGTLDNGQIIVNASKEDKIELVFGGVTITNKNGPAVYIMSCDKTTVMLTGGTVNKLYDSASYSLAEGEDEPDAALFSKDDLTIRGTGSLEVVGSYADAIKCKNDLKILGGVLNVTAAGTGIKGRDSVKIADATVSVTSDGDGVKTTNSEEEDNGYILIDSGNITVISGEDGISAQTYMTINGGIINITSGGGSKNSSTQSGGGWGDWGRPGSTTSSSDGESAKGLKCSAGTLTVMGGTLTIDSSDDSIHSDTEILISGGTLNLASGDDGIHADTKLTISKGTVNVTKSYEGLESSAIVINGGYANVTASDDGINAAGGNDSSGMGGRPGGGGFSSSSGSIEINGGTVVIDASGDGVDSNGTIVMTSGTVFVSGPTNGGNGALDYGGSFNISGGVFVAAGSTGMAQNISSSSSQCGVLAATGSQQANTLISLLDEGGNVIISYKPAKTYACIVISSPELVKGGKYSIYRGGTNSSLNADGYTTNGTLSGGTLVGTYTQSSVASTYGSTGGGGMGPGGRR